MGTGFFERADEDRRVLVCADNRVGAELLQFLCETPRTQVVGVIVHPERTARSLALIAATAERHGVPVFEIRSARRDFDAIARLSPDYLVSLYFDYILDDRFLSLPSQLALNLHPGYLPYNKGFYYYVWAQLDGTPAGVSIHRMVADVDAGEIISQARVRISPADTGAVIYAKHEDASIRLFRATWPAIVGNRYKLYDQSHPGTRHRVAETEEIAHVDPFERVRVIDFLDRVRVLTGSQGPQCTIELGGTRYRLAISLTPADETVTGDVPVSAAVGSAG